MINKEDYIAAVKDSFNVADVCRKLNKSTYGGSYQTIYRLAKKYNVDISHLLLNKKKRSSQQTYHRDTSFLIDILKQGVFYQTYKLKQRLIKCGLKESKCEICGVTEWNGKPINLELHHINGDRTDNRLENLQILCPNCHSQTDNFRSKKLAKNYKEEEYLLNEITEEQKKILSDLSEYKEKILLKRSIRYCKSNERKKIIKEKEELLSKYDWIELSKNSKTFSELEEKASLSEKTIKMYFKAIDIFDEIKNNMKANHYKCTIIPTKELIIQYGSENPSIRSIAKKFGISDKGLVKWLKKLDLPYKSKDLREFIKKFGNKE